MSLSRPGVYIPGRANAVNWASTFSVFKVVLECCTVTVWHHMNSKAGRPPAGPHRKCAIPDPKVEFFWCLSVAKQLEPTGFAKKSLVRAAPGLGPLGARFNY